MTRLYVNGKSTAVTVLQMQPTYVLQLKTVEKDGYKAVQVGAVKQKKVTKPQLGHIKKAIKETESGLQFIAEFKGVDLEEERSEFGITDFAEKDLLDITGVTIGRGTTGVVKRWGFHGQPASHGHDHVRAVGSMGSRWPQRVVKGKKMAGHYGNENLTLKKVPVIAIDGDKDLIFVKGSLPGANSSFLKIKKVA